MNLDSYLHCYKKITHVEEKLKYLNRKYFRNIFQISIKDDEWFLTTKFYDNDNFISIILFDENYTMKVYNSSRYDFFNWVKIMILNYFGVKFHGTIENGNHHPIHPDKHKFKEFRDYMQKIEIIGPEEFRHNLIMNTIPRKIRKLFSIFNHKDN